MLRNAVRGSTLVLTTLAVCLTASAQDIFTIPPGRPDRDALGGPEVQILCMYSESLTAPLAFGDLQPASVEAQRTINTMLKKIGVKKAIPAYVGPVPNAAAAIVGGQRTEGSPVDTPTHPAKDKRIREITNGFNDTDDKRPIDPTGPDILDESAPTTRPKRRPPGDRTTQSPLPETQEPDGTGTGTETPDPAGTHARPARPAQPDAQDADALPASRAVHPSGGPVLLELVSGLGGAWRAARPRAPRGSGGGPDATAVSVAIMNCAP